MKNMAEYRYTLRDSYCRGCHKGIKPKTDKVIIFSSCRGKGTTVILCDGCLDTINRVRVGEVTQSESFSVE